MPFVRLWGLSSLQSIINFAITGNFYGLWTTGPWMQRYLRCLNMTSCSATPASGSCFTQFRVCVMCDCGCMFLDPCRPTRLPHASEEIPVAAACASQALQTPFIQPRTDITPPLCRATSAKWQRVHLRLSILCQRQKLCSWCSTKVSGFTVP